MKLRVYDKKRKMQNKSGVSIIILNWNTKLLLKNCLTSIHKYINTSNYEIIIVDNNSSDGSAEMVGKNFPDVLLIRNEDNLGFSKGNNIGAKQATKKNLLFLNSDTLFTPQTDIKYLLFIMESRHDIGLTSCQLLNNDGSVQKSVRNFPYPAGVFFQYIGLSKMLKNNAFFNKYLMLNWEHNRESFISQPSGAFLLISEELFLEIGGFEEKFFMYFDDVDLCKKVTLEGKKIFFTPKCKIIHFGGKSAEQIEGTNFFERNKNLILYYKKYHSSIKVIIMKFLLFIAIIVRCIDWLIRSIFRKKYFYIFKESLNFLIKMWNI